MLKFQKMQILFFGRPIKEFVRRRKDGKPKSVARSFEDESGLDCGNMHPRDISDALSELNSVGLIKMYVVGFNLTDAAIVAMERRFKDVPEKIFSAASKTASLIETAAGSAAAYEKGKTTGS